MIMTGEANPNSLNITYPDETENTRREVDSHTGSKKHILVVDDDEFMLNFLHSALSRRNYEVTTAGGGAEGIRLFRQQYFDLVITDCIMPGTDGWQLAALIKQISAHTPVIMVTGQNKEDILDKLQVGNIDYLIFKPFKLDNLYKTVRTSVEDKSSSANSPSEHI